MYSETQDSGASPQVQDQWGRSPGDPEYGQPPTTPAPAYKPNATGTTAANGGLVPYDPAKVWPGSGGSGTVAAPNPPLTPSTPPQSPQPGAPPSVMTTPAAANPTDWDWVQQQVLATAQQMQAAGQYVNPSVLSDPGYWADRIIEKGGWADLGPDKNNINYFSWRFGLPEGAPELAGEGGTAAATTPMETMPQVYTGAPTPTVSAPAAPQPSAATTTRSDALYNMLLARAQQGEHVDPNDPIVKAQTDAYDASQQRARRNYLQAEAERQGPLANIGAETRSSSETVGQNTALFQSQLLARELTARRDEIQNALTSMQAYLTDEQKMELEAQLAQMNSALQYAQLNQQASQFDKSLGQQASQFDKSLGQRAYEFDTTRQDNVLGA